MLIVLELSVGFSDVISSTIFSIFSFSLLLVIFMYISSKDIDHGFDRYENRSVVRI